MDKIDVIFTDMDKAVRDELKNSIAEYKQSGDPAAKERTLNILKKCDDRTAIRRFLNEF